MAPTELASASADTCDDVSGEDALAIALAELPEFADAVTNPLPQSWDTNSADVSTFDACANLSWIVLPSDNADHHSPHHVLLFHEDEYIIPATTFPPYSEPTIERLTKSSISITWHWGGHDDNGDHKNYATSVYTWDTTIAGLVREGDLPPVTE